MTIKLLVSDLHCWKWQISVSRGPSMWQGFYRLSGFKHMSTPTISASELQAEDELVFGQGKAMEALNASVVEIARTDIPVLILGESGTGKEVYARLLHRLSRCSDSPLIKVGCSILDPSRLLEQFRDGLLSTPLRNHPGTLFLDSVDEPDLACQRVLLSMLPDGQGRKGAGSPVKRLICSSSRNLEEDVEAGRSAKNCISESMALAFVCPFYGTASRTFPR